MQGYQVTPFDDSDAAYEAFSKDPDRFDLVVTDMAMPKMTGDKLSEKLLKIRPDLPIIICTGYHDTFTEASALAIGIARYVHKPVMGSELSRIIRDLMDGLRSLKMKESAILR